MRYVSLVVCVLALAGCERSGEGSGADSSSRFERGMEKVGKQIETAAQGVGTELSETRIQMIIDNIKGMDSVQAEITGPGSVTLIGTVAVDQTRAEAERLVRMIEGVTSVRNAIVVGGAAVDSSASAGVSGDTATPPDSSRPSR